MINLFKKRSRIENWVFLFFFVFFLSLPSHAQTEENAQGKFKEALSFFKNGNYSESALILEELVFSSPDKPLFWFNLGNAQFMLENYGRAISAYQKVIELRSPLSTPAKIYIVKSYRKLGDLDFVLKYLKQVKTATLLPGINSEFREESERLQEELLAKGIDSYRNEIYAEALLYFNKALELGPNQKASMMRGFTLLKLGKPKEAKVAFDNVISSSETTGMASTYKEDAKYFTRRLNQGIWAKDSPYWLFINLSGGYDSNVYEGGQSESLTSKGIALINIGAGYRFLKNNNFSGRIAYNFGWEEFLDLSSLRILNNLIRIPFSYIKKSWLIQLEPQFQHEFLGTDSFLFKIGTALLVERSWKDIRIGISYEFHKNFSGSSEFDYLSGTSQFLSAYWQYRKRSIMVGPYAVFFIEDMGDLTLTTGTLPLANTSFGPGIRAWWSFAPLWKASLNTSFLFKNYDNKTQPDNIERDDKNLSGALKISRIITHNFEIFIESDFRINWSTLGETSTDDKNYRQFVLLGGISWNVFP